MIRTAHADDTHVAQQQQQQQQRRPSVTLSDSGNEAQWQRGSLSESTAAVYSAFVRRPSWIAGESIHLVESEMDTSALEPPPVPPHGYPVERRGSSWEFLDTFDYYIENEIDPSQSINSIINNNNKLNNMNDVPMAVCENINNSSSSLPPPTTAADADAALVAVDEDRRPAYYKTSSTTSSNNNNSNRVLDRSGMLKSSVKTWDPRLSGNSSSFLSVRRSTMSSGTGTSTLRRMTNSLRMSDLSMDLDYYDNVFVGGGSSIINNNNNNSSGSVRFSMGSDTMQQYD